MARHYTQKKVKPLRIRSYLFRAVVEPDQFESDKQAWRAYVPQLEAEGAASWGHTPEEALRNLQVVTQLVVEDILAMKQRPPALQVSKEPLISVAA